MPNNQDETGKPIPPSATPPLDNRMQGEQITAAKMNELVSKLEELLNHTHIFFDDYGTACNCNCNCNCTRGTL